MVDFGKNSTINKFEPPRAPKPTPASVGKLKIKTLARIAGRLTHLGYRPKKHQIQAIIFALQNNNTYLALAPGLGKTLCAAACAAYRGGLVIYVCPPFLVANVKNEFRQMGIREPVIVPDSFLAKRVNEIIDRTRGVPREKCFLIVDEAHRFKNEKTGRTAALLSIAPHFGKATLMSGTPLPNARAKELWPILKTFAPEVFGVDFFPFALKYCGARKGAMGWDFSGFTNRGDFTTRITKRFMLRMKQNVLPLPDKTEELLVVGPDTMPKEISSFEKQILNVDDIIRGDVLKLSGADGDVHLATYLRLLGSVKAPYVAQYVSSILESSSENVLLFAIHRETIKKLHDSLAKWNPVVITGAVEKNVRQRLVEEFQMGARRVFIGNIAACGVGFTLTKASRVVFGEFSWVPGENNQAGDRAYRIGQTKNVRIQYAVLNNSIDHKRMNVVLRKTKRNI